MSNVWKSIDTAPQDSTRILLFRRGWFESVAVGYWDEDFKEWRPVQGSCFPEPTHWTEIPLTPDSDSESK